jgi:hypothetical protein
MRWELTYRDDPRGRALADRHYSRQTPGASGFVPPGACLVLVTPGGDAVWVTSWPRAEYVKHEWAGAWTCSIFRNESPHLSSELIREAVAATLAEWPSPPELGIVTFVDPGAVRRKRDPGRCFLRAGFVHLGWTRTRGYRALGLAPAGMPAPERALNGQAALL